MPPTPDKESGFAVSKKELLLDSPDALVAPTLGMSESTGLDRSFLNRTSSDTPSMH